MADGRFALLVGSSQYADETLTRLQAPAHDVGSLAEVLGASAIGGFQVRTLVDQPSVVVAQEIEAFFDGRRRNDLILLYFSGHGILDASSRLYFAAADTRVDRPRSTAIPASFVNDLMAECLSRRQVLILDCCNSGAFARGRKAGKTSVGTRERFEGRGRMVITASDALQYAFEAGGKVDGEAGGKVDGEPVGSVFTEKLVEGLRTGEADRDRDGWISLDELYDYAYEAVLDTAPRQRPGKWAFGVEGQLFIARSPFVERPATRPAGGGGAVPAEKASPSRWPTLLSTRRARWAALLAAVAVVAALVGVLQSLGGGKPSPSSAASLEPERAVAIRVYDAWTQKRLTGVPTTEISGAARQVLIAMPVQPVTPEKPAPSDCYGSSGGAQCYFHYLGLGIFLNFEVLRYPHASRVNSVTCYTENPPAPKNGGIPACARIVTHS